MAHKMSCGCEVVDMNWPSEPPDYGVEYCSKHNAVDKILETLYHCFLWMRASQKDGSLSTESDGFNKLLNNVETIIDKNYFQKETPNDN